MPAGVEEHRDSYGVESICAALPIAAATSYQHRARRDESLRTEIRRVFEANLSVYGADKVWQQLLREGIEVARCTVERLMSELGLHGAVRGRAFKTTTVAEGSAVRPPDLVEREFHASRRPALGGRPDLGC